MTASIRVLGVSQTLARFAAAVAIADAAMAVTKETLASDVADGAKAMVPVDTGQLQDSIQSNAESVTVSAPYAAYVEYGTSNMPAEPFLRPAADTVDDTHAVEAGATVMRTA